ncbi:MAG: cytochrome c biogenesis protein CcsA, partial [Candidatus Korarchaeota archaeon]|nr:cytochrome c biogenesis protein CcsA [Candidatus Korarchaeota archaeon]
MHYTGLIALMGGAILLADLTHSSIKGRIIKLGLVAYAILLADWILYVWAFLTQDYTLKPVYETSSMGLPLMFKIASSWSSGGGSLFLLTTVLATVALIHRRYHRDTMLNAGYGALIISSLALAFLNGAFESFHGDVATGMGLNPLLKSPWIYPHPLSTFTAYALIAASAVSLYSGHEKASDLLARVGWLLLTLGIAIGGYWSYVTFGWGGYWAWDPVETAELTPWLALTAAFHVKSLDRKLSYATQMTAAGSVFLAILVTRVGISPLHSFASPQSMTSALTLLLTFLFIAEGVRGSRGASIGIGKVTSSPYRTGLVLSYFSLFMMFLVLFSVLAGGSIASALGMRVDVPQMDSGIEFFHPLLFPFALLLMVSLPMCTIGARLGWREILGVIEGLSIVSAILLYLTFKRDIIWSPASSLTTNLIISIMLPFTVAGLFSGLAALYIYARDRLSTMSSVSLLHAAMALTMLGVLMSGPFAYNRSYFRDITLPYDRELDVDGLGVKLKGYEYSLYGGKVDLYTPYVGRSDIYRRASLTMLSLTTNFGEALLEMKEGEKRLEETGILGIYRDLKGGVRMSGSYRANASAVLTEVSNASKESRDLGEVSVSISDPVIASFLGASANETTLRMIVVGNVTLRGNLASIRASPTVMINLTFQRPLILNAPKGTVEIGRASIVFFDMLKQGHSLPKNLNGTIVAPNSTLVIEKGVYHGERDVEIPSTIRGRDVVLYVAFTQGTISSDVLKILEDHGLSRLLTNETFTSKLLRDLLPGNCKELIHERQEAAINCLGYLPIPKELPEGAKLSLTLEAGNSEELLEIRFDANGEAQGIHGLVAHVLTLPSGLGDLYMVFHPPVVKDRKWSIGFHELMVYYLHESFRGLNEEQKLALASLFASAYLGQSV